MVLIVCKNFLHTIKTRFRCIFHKDSVKSGMVHMHLYVLPKYVTTAKCGMKKIVKKKLCKLAYPRTTAVVCGLSYELYRKYLDNFS